MNADGLPRLGPDDLRAGDLLLLTPGEQPRPISQIAVVMDGGAYSHSAILGQTTDRFYTFGANQALPEQDLVSGVNAIALGLFNGKREIAVVRDANDVAREAAVGVAESFVEHWLPPRIGIPEPPPDTSAFGWEQLVLSSMACFARQLRPGSRARRRLWNAIHGASKTWLGDRPVCGFDHGTAPDDPMRWDCSHFVDHAFCTAGYPLGVVESDPPERRPWTSLAKVIGIIAATVPRCPNVSAQSAIVSLLPDDDLIEAMDDYEEIAVTSYWFDLLRDVLGQLFCGIGVDPPAVEPMMESDGWPQPGEAAWPPFVSPRMLGELPTRRPATFQFVGVLPVGAVPAPPSA